MKSYYNQEKIASSLRNFFNKISSIISKFCVKHSDNKIHISFDHMFCKDKFTILLFSLRIGKQRHPSLVSLFQGKTQSRCL